MCKNELFNTIRVTNKTTGEVRIWERICTKRGLNKHINSKITKWGYAGDDIDIEILSQRTPQEEIEHCLKMRAEIYNASRNDLEFFELHKHYSTRIAHCMRMLHIFSLEEIE